jgi:hypothetical protein
VSENFFGRLVRKPAYLGWAYVGHHYEIAGVGETVAEVRRNFGPGLVILKYGELPPTVPPPATPDLRREEREALDTAAALRARLRRRPAV